MLIFCDGFDHYTFSYSGNSAASATKWDSVVAGGASWSSIATAAGNGRPSLTDSLSGGALVTPGWAAGGGPCGCLLQKALGVNASTLYVGFAVKINGAVGHAPEDCTIFSWLDVGTVQLDLRVEDVSGQLYFIRSGSNILDSGAVVLSYGAWYYVEVKVVFHTSAGSIELRVNGTTVASATGLNTAPSTRAYANIIRAGSYGTGGALGLPVNFDDLYVCDNTGSVNNNFLGESRIRAVFPTGDGTTSEFTATFAAWASATAKAIGNQIEDSNGNVQRVTSVTGDAKTGGSAPTWSTTPGGTTTDNHVTWTCKGASAPWLAVAEPTPDSSDSYVADATVGEQSRFTFPAVSGQSVKAVVVWAYAAKDDAGARMIRGVAKSGTTVGDNGVDKSLSNTYAYYPFVFESNPDTSAAWTISEVNAAEFGVKVTV